MADKLAQTVSGARDAILSIRVATKPAGTIVTGRPRKLDAAAVMAMLLPGEKLISWGTTPKSTYFAVNEHMIFSVLALPCFYLLLAPVWQAAKVGSFLAVLVQSINPLSALIIFALVVAFAICGVRHSNYVLTDKRLIYLGTFAFYYDLRLFTRADLRKSDKGASYIELWQTDDSGPAVVVQLGAGVAADEIISAFPLAIGPPTS